ncbi:S-layer homology domain-containing protein [Demequina sp. NBRC 110053]|uniref:S-layer homology domain-containing protein n=1 Tax=Demequina sp. NBRC 110053 TaxID=1570342 RepID=UPI0009FBBBA7|nr:S-layer homology domain-containing protein [Demequina sp. NBRC 110053]
MFARARAAAAATATAAIALTTVLSGATAASAAASDAVTLRVVIAVPSLGSESPLVFDAAGAVGDDDVRIETWDTGVNETDVCRDLTAGIAVADWDGWIDPGADCPFTTITMTMKATGESTLGGAGVFDSTVFDPGQGTVTSGVRNGTATVTLRSTTAGTYDSSGSVELGILPLSDMPFVDVHGDRGKKGYSEHWMSIAIVGLQGFSQGWESSSGAQYRPLDRMTRDAFAVFLHRGFGAEPMEPSDLPFVDVSADPTSPHYSEHWESIAWMYQTGMSSGWVASKGREYRPETPMTRDAVASFLYRAFAVEPGAPAAPFVDVSANKGSRYYSEHAQAIQWMHDQGISMGWSTSRGQEYRPTLAVTRDAAAVFVVRMMGML